LIEKEITSSQKLYMTVIGDDQKRLILLGSYVLLDVFEVFKSSSLESGVHFREHKKVGWGEVR